MSETVRANKLIMDWIAGEFLCHESEQSTHFQPSEFRHRCVSTLEIVGDEATNVGGYDEAISAYSTVLSLGSLTPNTVLNKWARMMLIRGTVHEALSVASKVCFFFFCTVVSV